MSSFDARLRMPGQTRIPIGVVVDVSEERIVFKRGEESLGDWPLGEVGVNFRPDGFHLRLEEEEIVLSVSDAHTFASALGVKAEYARPVAAVAVESPADLGPYSATMNGIAGRLEKVMSEERFEDIRRRIDELGADMTDDDVSPSAVFGRWLELLKELNERHGHGSIPTPLFYRFNAELLEMIAAPPEGS